MVDSTTPDQGSQLKDSWLDTLEALAVLGGQAVGLDTIAEQQEVSKQAVNNRFPEIEEDGYITVEGNQKPYIYKLTGRGYRALDSTPYGAGKVDSKGGSEGGRMVRRLHGLTAVARTTGGEVLPEKWMGKMREHERVNFARVNSSNESLVWTNRFFIRLHKDSATIQNREGVDYSTDSDVEAFLMFHEDLQELLQWIGRATGVPMKLDMVDLRRAELAFEDHHLPQIVGAIPDLKLSDFVVEDEDLDKEVVTLDESFKKELETKTGEQAEAIGHVVEQEMRQYAHNPGAVRRRHEFENELLTQGIGGQEAVHTIRQTQGVREQLEQVRDRQEDMESKQGMLLELKREERETAASVRELAESNQAVLHELVDKVEDSQQGYRSVVDEKFAEYDNNKRFSTPFFHKDTGGLYAFRRDGSGCKKILSGDTVEGLKG